MKITVNDVHDNYVFLDPKEIFHDLILDGVGWRNLDLFMMLLEFYSNNKEEVASWIRTGWFDKRNIEKDFREYVTEILNEIDIQNTTKGE